MTADEIADRAEAWVVRADGGELPEPEASELKAWLEADPRHLGAYVRARAAWELLDRARALPEPKAAIMRRWPMAAGIAAAVALAAVGGALVLGAPRAVDYGAGRGEIRRVRLQDGSVAVLDSDTRLKAVMSGRRRRIEIARGVAWFEVAHDRSRPFVVRAGEAEVTAVGTAFSVRRTGQGADVMVTEGVVEARAAPAAAPAQVRAGHEASIADKAVHTVALTQDQIDRDLAWREGRIALDGVPLREAMARFNQYNVRKLVLADPALGDVSVVGWFSLSAPDVFAHAVAVGLHAEVETSPDTIVIARAKITDPE